MEGFADAPKRRGPSATDEERKACAERPLAEGASIRQAAKDAGVNRETSRRFAREGLIETVPPVSPDAAEGEEIAVEDISAKEPSAPLDRGTREMPDRAARMGRDARDAFDRVKTSKGKPRRSSPSSPGRACAFATPGS